MPRHGAGTRVSLILILGLGVGCSVYGADGPSGAGGAPNAQPPAPNPALAAPGRRGFGGPRRGFGGPGRVFGEVSAIRGNVVQMRTRGSEGLTRVILAADAQILGDETLAIDALKPGMKVTGMGAPGPGTGGAPPPVEVRTLTIQAASPGGPFGFGGFRFGRGGAGGPLLRGRTEVYRKVAGGVTFDARVQSVHPLVLVDEQGNSLNVRVGEAVEVHARVPRPLKEGDIVAGARLMATGDPTPDGLLNAHMITLLGEGSARSSLSGILMGISDNVVRVRPRFAAEELAIDLDPAAKVYRQETLDLSTIQAGDTLAFTGKVTRGDAQAPEALILHAITPADGETPAVPVEQRGRFGFGGGPVTATVKGKIIGFAPLRVQTEAGRVVTITVPGQVAYVRYQPAERSDLKAGERVLFAGRQQPGGLLADLIILNPSLAMGPEY